MKNSFQRDSFSQKRGKNNMLAELKKGQTEEHNKHTIDEWLHFQ